MVRYQAAKQGRVGALGPKDKLPTYFATDRLSARPNTSPTETVPGQNADRPRACGALPIPQLPLLQLIALMSQVNLHQRPAKRGTDTLTGHKQDPIDGGGGWATNIGAPPLDGLGDHAPNLSREVLNKYPLPLMIYKQDTNRCSVIKIIQIIKNHRGKKRGSAGGETS